MNRVSPAVQDSRAAKRGIARDRNVNASSAGARSRAAAHKAADDKADWPCINRRGSLLSSPVIPALPAEGFDLCLSSVFIT
jgi:hypothetical protein